MKLDEIRWKILVNKITKVILKRIAAGEFNYVFHLFLLPLANGALAGRGTELNQLNVDAIYIVKSACLQLSIIVLLL